MDPNKDKSTLDAVLERMDKGVGKILDLQKETTTRLDSLEARQKAFEAEIAKVRAESGDALKLVNVRAEKLERAVAPRLAEIPGLDKDEAKKFSLARAVLGIATKDFSNAGFEKEVMDQAAKDMEGTHGRALSAGTDSAGSYLVPMQAIPGFIELLRARSIARQLGVGIMDGLVGSPVEIMKQTGGATAYAVGENKDVTPSDQADGMINAHPHAIAGMTVLSRRLARMSQGAAERMVRDDLAKVLALFEDKMVFKGAGSAGEPLGVANVSGILTSSLATIGTNPYEKLVDFVGKLETANALVGKLGWALHPTGRQLLAKRKDADGRPLFFNAMASAGEGLKPESTLIAYPWATSTQLAATDAFFANWEDILLCEWGAMEIRASMETSTAFARNQIWIQVLKEIDVIVRHPESICYVSDLAA